MEVPRVESGRSYCPVKFGERNYLATNPFHNKNTLLAGELRSVNSLKGTDTCQNS